MNLIVLFSLAILLLLLLSPGTKENLRIQGSHDIRGDPYIPYNPAVSPWNIGSSLPIRNRQMIIQPFDNEFLYDSQKTTI